MSSEWIKYICKSGQTLFVYNKVTGEHRWCTKGNRESIQDDVTHGEPILHKELLDVSTQTDDNGCPNGCTSIYIDTNLETLANSVVEATMNGFCEKNGRNSVHRIVENDAIVNGYSPSNCVTTLENNFQHVNKRKRLININVTNGKHSNIMRNSVHNALHMQTANGSSPPSLESNSQGSQQLNGNGAVLLNTNIPSVNLDLNDGTSLPVINSVSSIQTSNTSFSQSCTNGVEGTSQEINVIKTKPLLDTNVTNSGIHEANVASNMGLPIITSVSSIRPSNESALPSSPNNVEGSSQEVNVNKRKRSLDSIIPCITNENTHGISINGCSPIISNVSTIHSLNGSSSTSCTSGVENISQIKQVNRRKRFLFTNYIPKGKHLVKAKSKDSVRNVQVSNANSSPSKSKSSGTKSQKVSTAPCGSNIFLGSNQNNVEYNANASDKNLRDDAIRKGSLEDLPPGITQIVGSETYSNESPPVVIANVFSYATGKVYSACHEGQKDQCLVDSVGISENKSPDDCSLSTEKQAVTPGVNNSSDPPQLQRIVMNNTEDDTEELTLDEHHSLIAQQLKCGNCNRDFNSRAHLDAHLQKYTGEQPFRCCYCGKTFTDNGDLLIHLRTHMTSKPYKCSFCDKAFRHNSSLSVHLKLHTGEKSYKCPSCEKTFRQKIHLRNHLRVHTTEHQFKCSDCEKKFKTNSELVVHLLSHSGIRPYKCRFCDRLFSQECHLRSHEQAHCKQKDDKCPYCNKVFKFGSSLTLHLRTHTGERPFKCSQCSLTFRQKQHLIVHVRRHTGEKPFVCKHCSKAFRHDTGLRSHLLIHPESDYSKAQAEMYTADQLMKKAEESSNVVSE